jgi:putative transposase
MNDHKTISFSRRRLPHWEVLGGLYFVTFRIRRSLPQKVILKLKEKRNQIIGGNDSERDLIEFQRYEFREIENVLDRVNNDVNAFLARDDIAPILMESFEFIEKKYCWRFISYVIMPNHIHCLCLADKDGEKKSLTQTIGIFKQYTAREINKKLNRKGRLWVDENFDHWCRDFNKEESVKRYIEQNPVKGGLVKESSDWKWKK